MKIESSYRNAGTRCRSLMHNFELKRESEVILSNNIGSFYKFINKLMSCKQGVGALIKHDGGYATGDADRANLLNNFLALFALSTTE
jgi:hypothetical protein